MAVQEMHTIQYKSSRRELWRWYWRVWARPKGLWRYHVAAAIFGGVLFVELWSPKLFTLGFLIENIVGGLVLCLLLFSLWPQIKYKRSIRTLTINPEGIDTTIGSKSGKRKWSEIARIDDNGKEIVVTMLNMNAFIIPMRAFSSDGYRTQFLSYMMEWKSKNS